MATVYIATVGCRLNQFESDALEQRALELGHRVVRSPTLADLQIINSCAITAEADADTRQLVRRAARANPRAELILTGCYATGAPLCAASLPGVTRVVSNADKALLLTAETGATAESGRPAADPVAAWLRPAVRPRRTRAYLKIQDGCDFACAYCIVPGVRGPSRSLPVTTVCRDLEGLIAAGQAEICLTGVHIGTYGRDLAPRSSLADLISVLLPRLGTARLRLGSIDPHEVTPELIGLLAENHDRICRHVHLPAQSGDPEVLRRMRRAHTVDDLRRAVTSLHEAVPGIALGSDVIAGFPGEDEAASETTLRLLAELPLAYLHVFSFSRRPGTAAHDMPDQIPRRERKSRSARLRRLGRDKAATFARRFIGDPLPAVVLSKRHSRTGNRIAVTDNYLEVELVGGDDPPVRTWVTVELMPSSAETGPHPARLLAGGS